MNNVDLVHRIPDSVRLSSHFLRYVDLECKRNFRFRVYIALFLAILDEMTATALTLSPLGATTARAAFVVHYPTHVPLTHRRWRSLHVAHIVAASDRGIPLRAWDIYLERLDESADIQFENRIVDRIAWALADGMIADGMTSDTLPCDRLIGGTVAHFKWLMSTLSALQTVGGLIDELERGSLHSCTVDLIAILRPHIHPYSSELTYAMPRRLTDSTGSRYARYASCNEIKCPTQPQTQHDTTKEEKEHEYW